MTTLTLQEKEHLVGNIWSFRFRPSTPQTWIAGQYMSVELPHEHPDDKGPERLFTISSAPFQEVLEITTRISDSSFKQALTALPIGGQLHLRGRPEGDFTWEDTDKTLVFAAGGIGITSFRSILKQRAHDQLPLNVHLIYGNQTEEIAFKNEFDEYAESNPDFTVDYAVGEPLTADKLSELAPRITDSLVYVSGPAPMVAALGKELKAAGLPSEQFKQDRYAGYDKNA